MNVFNDNDGLKHPAFHDEVEESKKKTWSKILDFLFVVFIMLGLVALILFCIFIGDSEL